MKAQEELMNVIIKLDLIRDSWMNMKLKQNTGSAILKIIIEKSKVVTNKSKAIQLKKDNSNLKMW